LFTTLPPQLKSHREREVFAVAGSVSSPDVHGQGQGGADGYGVLDPEPGFDVNLEAFGHCRGLYYN